MNDFEMLMIVLTILQVLFTATSMAVDLVAVLTSESVLSRVTRILQSLVVMYSIVYMVAEHTVRWVTSIIANKMRLSQ